MSIYVQIASDRQQALTTDRTGCLFTRTVRARTCHRTTKQMWKTAQSTSPDLRSRVCELLENMRTLSFRHDGQPKRFDCSVNRRQCRSSTQHSVHVFTLVIGLLKSIKTARTHKQHHTGDACAMCNDSRRLDATTEFATMAQRTSTRRRLRNPITIWLGEICRLSTSDEHTDLRVYLCFQCCCDLCTMCWLCDAPAWLAKRVRTEW